MKDNNYKEAYALADQYMKHDDELSKVVLTTGDWFTIRDRLADMYIDGVRNGRML